MAEIQDDSSIIYMDTYYHIECCICLNSFDYEFIITHCCKKNIHKICLMDWILSCYNIELKCPMCRQDLYNITETISYNEFKEYINTLVKNKFSYPSTHLIDINYKKEKYMKTLDTLYNIYPETNSDDCADHCNTYCRILLILVYLSFLFLIIFIILQAFNLVKFR